MPEQIKNIDRTTRSKMEGSALDQLVRAQGSERWAAIYLRVENGQVVLDETTCNFPYGDFSVALRLVTDAFRRKEGALEPEPLPRADLARARQELMAKPAADAVPVNAVPQGVITKNMEGLPNIDTQSAPYTGPSD